MPLRERACRECKRIGTSDVCENCGSSNLTSAFSGLLIIIDPESSEVAKLMGITKPGKYAVKVG